MTVTLTVDEVESFTGVTVNVYDIDLAAQLLDDQTGHTPTEHNTERAVPVLTVQAAWALVAVRVHRMLNEDVSPVSSETQGDYSYSEDAGLARTLKFSNVTDGRPRELLNLDRARWAPL